jgi:hypothetical protein
MEIGIQREKHQIGVPRMLTVEGQDVIKVAGKIISYIYCVSNDVKTKRSRKVTCAVHAAHWVKL